jgi:DNA-binding transcriptional regulator YbjK
MNNSTPDAGIPVLTEIISPPASSIASPPESPESISDDQSLPIFTAQAPSASLHSQELKNELDAKERWEQLETELRERVLQQVLDRIDFVLEQRVRDSLADVLQTAVEGLASEIRTGLHHTLKEVVTRAVSQELIKAQSLNK